MDWKSAIIGGLAIVGGLTLLMVAFGFVAKTLEERRRQDMMVKRLMDNLPRVIPVEDGGKARVN